MANRLLRNIVCNNRILIVAVKIIIHADILRGHFGRGLVEGGITRHPVKRIEGTIQTF